MEKTNRVLWPLGLALLLGFAWPASAQEETLTEGAEAPSIDSAPAADAASAEAAPAEALADTLPDMESTEEPQGFFRSTFPDFDVNIGGYVRTDNAFSTSDEDNFANQLGNVFNERPQARQAFVPPGFLPTACAGASPLPPEVCGLLGAPVPTWTSMAFPVAAAGDAATPGLRGTFSANPPAVPGGASQLSGTPFPLVDNSMNYQIVRTEVETSIKLTPSWSLNARIRGIFDTTRYDEFDAGSVENTIATGGGGIRGGDPTLYHGRPNYFEYRVENDDNPNPLEFAGRNYMVDFPTLVADYTNGPLNLRFGNQSIAWGQALFFRVFDVANGLDLRRHLVLDYAQEEYADERVPALGLRAGWQFNDEWLADGFVQQFRPTVYGNPNTQYNVIPVGFTVHDLYAEDDYDKKVNFGLRLKGNYGQWGVQAMAVQRYNPDGVFRWTRSGVNRNLPCANVLDSTIACRVELSLIPQGTTSGNLLAETAFEVAPGGVYSADEWFNYAGKVRLDAVGGLNASIEEFPDSQLIYASAVANEAEARNELNTFFIAAGGSLRGHIAREYFKENVFALGGSYVTEGEPGGIFDQLIINLEHSYTPNRTFTNTTLSRNYPEMGSHITALVLEKYYRFSDAFPATYFVFQYMRRNQDDLFGRLLSGYGGTQTRRADGVDGANYYVFAFQQPFPQDVWRAGFATLYDPRGSILVQPGIRWKPRSSLQVDAFYSYIDGALGDANPNDTLLSTIDYADELTLRLTYQF